MAENISKIILNGTEYVIKDAATQYHTINGQAITGGTGDITITGGSGLKKWEGTRAEYNALSSYDADTLYIITDEDVEIPTVPTKVSAFENDAGYITEHQDLSDYALKTDIPVVPSKVSAFQNDAGYLTEHQDISNLATKDELNGKQDKGDYALKSNSEEITFTLEDGSTVTKKFILG